MQYYLPQCDFQLVGKMPKFSICSGDSNQKGEVSFEQLAFEGKTVMHSHTEVTLREGTVGSLHGATADMVQY